MYNIGLNKVKDSTIENFTSENGIKFRRIINRPLRTVLNLATKRKIVIESYAELEEDKPYIFASTHSFDEDIIAALATIDRSAYVLIGTTDQVDHNPQMYAAWLNGMIYVDRLNAESRRESVLKMEKILNSGTSILIFPEGGYNNTENLLCQPLFAGPYILAKNTGVPVVPIASFNEYGTDTIYIQVGNPLNLANLDKKEALISLRDNLATMVYGFIEKYSKHISRSELSGDIHLKYMEERKNVYMMVNWTKDVWDEELTTYSDKNIVTPQAIREFVDNVQIDYRNAKILAPILVKRNDDKKYNFKNYMKENWNK